MKKLFLAVLLAVPLMADVTPIQIDVPLHRGYIPIGFDDNDNVQVTVEGLFPDTCYKVGPAHASINPSTHEISVRQTAYRYGGICLQMLVPFTKTVDIGFGSAGDYALVDAVSGLNLGELPIRRSTHPEADDYLYAPIADAYVTTDAGIHTLILKGSFSDRCTVFKDVLVSYSKNVVVVQPIVERVTIRDCGGKTRFQRHVDLKTDLTGVYLLHVRSMEGQAINKMIELP